MSSVFAQSQDDVLQLEEIYITGSRIPVYNNRTSNTVVLDQQSLQHYSGQTLAQALQTVPGLYIGNIQTKAAISSVYVRGAETNYTKILLDGVEVNNPVDSRGGAFDLSSINVSSIERIEIVKTSNSSVYGSSALAGVINIITKKAQPGNEYSILGALDSNQGKNAGVSLNLGSNRVQARFAASYSDEGEQVDGFFHRGRSLNAAIGTVFHNNTKVSLNTHINSSDAKSFPDASGGDLYALNRDLETKKTDNSVAGVQVEQFLSGEDRLKYSITYTRAKETIDSPGVNASTIPPNYTRTDYSTNTLSASYYTKVISNFGLSIGMSGQQEEGESVGLLDYGDFSLPTDFNLKRRLYAIHMEMAFDTSEQWRSRVSVRADKPEGMEREFSSAASLSYDFGDLTFHVEWGSGFKLPSFFALAHPLVGNGNFQSETSETRQIGMEFGLTDDLPFSINVFDNRYHDLIDFGDSGVLVARPEVKIRGVEFIAEHYFNDTLKLSTSYTYLDYAIEDKVNGDDTLNNRPERMASIAMNWQLNSQLSVVNTTIYTGSQSDFTFIQGDKKLDSYIRDDVYLSWKINKHVSSRVVVSNIFNQSYQISTGNQAPNRTLKMVLESTW